jgi:glycosyltransferase involved in cell wall biosynthesis
VSLRVGILPIADQPSAGGGFTFEQETFGQLIRLASETPHRFLVLDAPPEARRTGLPPNVAYGPARADLGLLRRRRSLRVRLPEMLEKADVDVVLSLSGVAHPIPDVPYVTIVWDLQHRLQPVFPEVSAGGEWEKRERDFGVRLRRASAIVCGTQTGRREIAAFYQVPEPRIHVLPQPTPRWALEAAPQDDAQVRRRFGLDGEYLLYPAQFWPHKNHANLLLALRRLHDDGLALSLALVGSDKGNAGRTAALARRLGLERHVRFLGFVSIPELVALYRGARALSYPSFFGPDNLPPLEAFALGCPVVAAEVSGAREQLGDAALLVDATRPEELARALATVHRDEGLRAALVARGRERAARWTGADYVRGVFRILDGLEPFVRCWRDTDARG